MRVTFMKKHLFLCLTSIAIGILIPLCISGQKRPAKTWKICGNPNIKCRTVAGFQKHEIGFEIPKGNTVIADSEPFYAIVLKTVKLSPSANCDNAISEKERLEIQALFPRNKVFALKCSEAGDVYYTNVANDVNFIAVYAGKTLAAANGFLKTVKATGKFKGANLRKMQAGINGT